MINGVQEDINQIIENLLKSVNASEKPPILLY